MIRQAAHKKIAKQVAMRVTRWSTDQKKELPAKK
jgi:hypothetical protein